jgi:hypothetical protein
MALFLLENRDFLGFRIIFKEKIPIFSEKKGDISGTVNLKYTVIELTCI